MDSGWRLRFSSRTSVHIPAVGKDHSHELHKCRCSSIRAGIPFVVGDEDGGGPIVLWQDVFSDACLTRTHPAQTPSWRENVCVAHLGWLVVLVLLLAVWRLFDAFVARWGLANRVRRMPFWCVRNMSGGNRMVWRGSTKRRCWNRAQSR